MWLLDEQRVLFDLMPGSSLFGKKKFSNLFTPVRMIIILKKKLCKNAEIGPLLHCLWGRAMVQLLWKTVLQFFK